MISKVIDVAHENITDLNMRLLVSMRLNSDTCHLSAEETSLVSRPEFDVLMAETGMSLCTFDFGPQREWGDLHLRYEFLLIARDLATQKDHSWVSVMCGLPSHVATELVTATHRQLHEMAKSSTAWRFRYPVDIFLNSANAQRDRQYTAARMILSGGGR